MLLLSRIVTVKHGYCDNPEDVPTTAQYLLCVCDIFLLYWDDVGVVCIFRTFTHNMLAFGLSRKLCNDFLKKQAVIGNLNEGKARSSLGLVQFSCIHGSMFSYIGIIKGSYLKVEIIIEKFKIRIFFLLSSGRNLWFSNQKIPKCHLIFLFSLYAQLVCRWS